jgi:hypothetical protein
VDSLLLELLAPRRLGVSCESPNLVEDHKKNCITRSFEQILVCGLDLCGVTKPRDKSCVSYVLAHCACSCSSFSHHSAEELFISF